MYRAKSSNATCQVDFIISLLIRHYSTYVVVVVGGGTLFQMSDPLPNVMAKCSLVQCETRDAKIQYKGGMWWWYIVYTINITYTHNVRAHISLVKN